MNHFYKRKLIDSSGLANKNDLSLECKTSGVGSRSYGRLRKCFSCDQIHVLRDDSHDTKKNIFNRSVSTDEVKLGLIGAKLGSKSLLNKLSKCDIGIDANERQSRFSDDNPVIKITQNFQTIQDFDESEAPFDSLALRPNYSNLSSTSAEDGSSPADMSPSDYYSHDDNWDIDSNTNSCDKSCVPSDSAAAHQTICDTSATIDCVNCSNQKSRSLR